MDIQTLLRSVDDACQRQELEPLLTLLGALTTSRDVCLQAIEQRLFQREKLSQGKPCPDLGAGKVHERWITAKDAASRLGISLRTLRRRATSHLYAAFCVPQPRGFKVSESRLDEFMRRAR